MGISVEHIVPIMDTVEHYVHSIESILHHSVVTYNIPVIYQQEHDKDPLYSFVLVHLLELKILFVISIATGPIGISR